MIRITATVDENPDGTFIVNVSSPDLPGVSEVYAFRAKDDNEAAWSGIRSFAVQHDKDAPCL